MIHRQKPDNGNKLANDIGEIVSNYIIKNKEGIHRADNEYKKGLLALMFCGVMLGGSLVVYLNLAESTFDANNDARVVSTQGMRYSTDSVVGFFNEYQNKSRYISEKEFTLVKGLLDQSETVTGISKNCV